MFESATTEFWAALTEATDPAAYKPARDEQVIAARLETSVKTLEKCLTTIVVYPEKRDVTTISPLIDFVYYLRISYKDSRI